MIELWASLSFAFVSMASVTIYINVYSHTKACIEDSLMIMKQSNDKVQQKLPIRNELREFIDVHLFCYRWGIFFHFFHYSCFSSFVLIGFNFILTSCLRLLKMLEDIIHIPIFCQLSVFGLQVSILLFELEMVNRWLNVAWNIKIEKNRKKAKK